MDRRGAVRIWSSACCCLAGKEILPPRWVLFAAVLFMDRRTASGLMAAGCEGELALDTSTVEIHHQTVISSKAGIYRTKIRVTSWAGPESENVRTDPDKNCPAGSPIRLKSDREH